MRHGVVVDLMSHPAKVVVVSPAAPPAPEPSSKVSSPFYLPPVRIHVPGWLIPIISAGVSGTVWVVSSLVNPTKRISFHQAEEK